MTIQELLDHIFEQSNADTTQFEEWVKSSRRFRTFAENYRDKIRKKLRTAQNEEALKSLYAELEVAYRLVGDQRLVIEYEKLGLGRQRGPDFSILYRTNTPINLEVTRLRFSEPPAETDLEAVLARKLTDVLLDKVGQMPSGTANALLIMSQYPASHEIIAGAAAKLRLRAEAKQNDYFLNRGYADALTFLKLFRHLSMISFRLDGSVSPTGKLTVWLNPLARYAVPKPLENLLSAVLV